MGRPGLRFLGSTPGYLGGFCALLALAYPMIVHPHAFPRAPNRVADNGRATSQCKCFTSTSWDRSVKAVGESFLRARPFRTSQRSRSRSA